MAKRAAEDAEGGGILRQGSGLGKFCASCGMMADEHKRAAEEAGGGGSGVQAASPAPP